MNDKQGYSIIIGLVLVWEVKDIYKTLFEIDSQTIATIMLRRQQATAVLAAQEKAIDEFRSTNKQLQWIINEALRKYKRNKISRTTKK